MSKFSDFVLEQLHPWHGISRKAFFGGTALYFQDTQFAMIMQNALYFVVDGTTRLKYEQMGSSCFSYLSKRGRVQVKKYHAVPPDLIENADGLQALAKEAVAAAVGLKKPAKPKLKPKIKKKVIA